MLFVRLEVRNTGHSVVSLARVVHSGILSVMQNIARILHRSVPTPPADFLEAETLKPLWQRCTSPALERVEPQSYCRGRLFVTVPGSAFAARLREDKANLLERLRAEPALSGIQEIVVRIAAVVPMQTAQKTRSSHSYPQATQCLVSLAGAVLDPVLSASLARLAETLEAGAKSPLRAMPPS